MLIADRAHPCSVPQFFTTRSSGTGTSVEKMQVNIREKTKLHRCYQCNGRFGLIRYKSGSKQFCSKACLAEYRGNSERELYRLKAWANFLNRQVSRVDVFAD